ncbi:MAG TPA: chromate transporter [Bryobacteraceae bacterium]|nr:chromate transporter [Bryobacteraceae bacterium]
MSLLLLYLVMLKATVTTLNGPMSLPLLREELVVKHRMMSDRELAASVTAAQTSPGPMGIYVVSAGYFAAGVPGAIAGWLALVTPAFVAVPLMRSIGRRLEHPRAQRVLDAMVLASAGLIVTSAVPLAQASIHTPLRALLAAAAFCLLVWTRVPTVLIIVMAGVAGCFSLLRS